MRASYLGRDIQVEKFRKDRVLIGDSVVVRTIYRDDDDRRFIKDRNGDLHRLVFTGSDNSMVCIWHHSYEIMEGE